ncbi:Sorting nexin-30 [Bulinus truncatus]|nr:Sorting nexin-30 [Bulinus truncatus]
MAAPGIIKDNEKTKFKDPLLTGFDKDSDDDGMESLDLEASAKSEEGSVSRSSSLIANFRLDDDYDGETRDLFIIVDDPEKHTSTLEAYITFRVTTKTSRPEFDGTEFSVRRRYNDFLWIRQRLEENYPTHLVPRICCRNLFICHLILMTQLSETSQSKLFV